MRAIVYNGFGVAFCTEAEVALERLRVAIADADRAGYAVRLPSAAYNNAVDLYTRETGLTTRTMVAWGSVCTDLMNELQTAADRLNKEIKNYGANTSPVYRPDYQPPATGWDALPVPLKIAVGVGTLGLVAWALSSVAKVATVFGPRRSTK
jgi:hypothetical protein